MMCAHPTDEVCPCCAGVWREADALVQACGEINHEQALRALGEKDREIATLRRALLDASARLEQAALIRRQDQDVRDLFKSWAREAHAAAS